MMRSILATILCILFFAASAPAQPLDGTLKTIKDSGKIKIGYRSSNPPMSFLDKDNNPAGYSIDICKSIAVEVEKTIGSKIKTEYVAVTADDRFSALQENKIDILCGATTKTLSRGERVDFTQLTYVTGASLMILRENADSRNGLEGKKIGVGKTTTTEKELKNLIESTSTNAEIVLFESATEGIDALMKKTIDAYAADQVVLIGIAMKSDDPKRFTIRSEVFSFEPFALAVRRNDADFRLVADRAISELYRSKKIFDIYDNWIGHVARQRLPIFDAMVQLNSTPE